MSPPNECRRLSRAKRRALARKWKPRTNRGRRRSERVAAFAPHSRVCHGVSPLSLGAACIYCDRRLVGGAWT